jgi:tetratricopeptide (TPR) repeat protein
VSQGPHLSTHRLMDDALGHHRAGRFADAERIYRQILAIDPRHADGLHLLGMIEYQAGRLDSAAELISKAIAIHGKGVSYYVNLGTVVHAQGKQDEAEALYRQALALNPNLAEVHVNLGNVLQGREEFDESVGHYVRALELKPDNAETWNNLGNARQEQGRLDEAIACYQRALALKPDYAEVYYNLGNASRAQDLLDEAVAYYHQALAISPEYAEAFYNLANVLRAQGNADEALLHYRRALNLRPDYAQAGFGEALTQLLKANFAVGWKNYEWRWRSIDHDTPKRDYPQLSWAGERLPSGRLLIWGEQGIGDEVMFAGLMPEVVRTGNRCILDCHPRLNALFTRSFPDVQVVSGCGPGAKPELDIASQLPSGSLPGLFRTTAAAFGATTSPYLVPDEARRQQLRDRYSDGRRIAGLAWYTNNRKTGRFRSINLAELSPLFERSDINWVSLQYGGHDVLEDQAALAGVPVLVDRTVDQLSDIDLFAAQIAAMDLVITIDNSTAHLAGALGVPVWVMLPFEPDWRWMLDRGDSPWYPAVRLFRQPRPGDWPSVIKNVESALTATFV